MILLIVKTTTKPQPKEAEVFSYLEYYNKYLRECKKRYWATPEGFQLIFPTVSFEDMKQSYYIIPNNEEAKKRIYKYYNVIAEYDR